MSVFDNVARIGRKRPTSEESVAKERGKQRAVPE